MLIYNHKKEFLGIDKKDLQTFGFNTLAELKAEVKDFADLFVKKPGYIHNFKHVHWIDFVNYADISDESKVLINVNTKNFKATLSLSTIFLTDNPDTPAYIIHFNNLRPLSNNENENLSNSLIEHETLKNEPQEQKPFIPTQEIDPVINNDYNKRDSIKTIEEKPLDINREQEQEKTVQQENFSQEESIYKKPQMPQPEKPLEIEDISLDIYQEQEDEKRAPKEESKQQKQEEWDNGYRYDPHIASKELGLPLDLIEEFIQDFILQAKEFKPNIYNSIQEGDVENVKILSHKLKGVAANLRIEDAHEVLSAVSATNDIEIIHENLNTFYKIVAKLAKEPAQTDIQEETVEKNEHEELLKIEPEEEVDLLTFKEDEEFESSINIDEEEREFTKEKESERSLKDIEEKIELFEIEDDDVPQKIDLPELADDNFLDIAIMEENKTEENKETLFSKSEAAKEIGLDEESFNELFEDFITESRQILNKIISLLSKNDFENLKKEASKLKRMSENIRFNEFKNEIETVVSSQEREKIQKAIEKIDTIVTKISEKGI